MAERSALPTPDEARRFLRQEAERLRTPAPVESTPLADQNAGLRRISDLGVDVASGIAAIPQGFASLVPGLDPVADAIGSGRRALGDALYSDVRQAENQRAAADLQQADGFSDGFSTFLDNVTRDPALAVGMLGETLPGVVTGGAIARGIGAAGSALSGASRAAIGEGVVAGALSAGQINEQGGDYMQRLMGVPIGAATGLISGGANRLIGKMAQQKGAVGALGKQLNQAGDIDIALAGGAKQASGPLASRMAFGGIREGVFEELPQSLSEQALSNVALGDDITDGLGEAAAGGLLLGGVMGAGFSGLSGSQPADPLGRLRAQTAEVQRAKQAGLTREDGEVFKTEAEAEAARAKAKLDPERFEVVPLSSQPTRQGGATGLTTETGFVVMDKQGEGLPGEATPAQDNSEAREAARAELETELLGIKGIGKKTVERVLAAKSASEVEALAGKGVTKTRAKTIVESDAFKKYVDAAAIPDFRAGANVETAAPKPPPTVETYTDPVSTAPTTPDSPPVAEPPPPDPEGDKLAAELEKVLKDDVGESKLDSQVPLQLVNSLLTKSKTPREVAETAAEVFEAEAEVDPDTGALQKKLLPLNVLRNAILAYRGYVPSAAEVIADQPKSMKPDGTRKFVNRVKRDLPPELIDAFEELHSATRNYEQGITNFGRDQQLDIDEGQLKATGLPLGEVATPTGRADPPEVTANEASIAEDFVRSEEYIGTQQLGERQARMQNAFRQLEQLIGRDNVGMVQYLSKRHANTYEQQIDTVSKYNDGEPSDAVRFSIYAKQYKDGTILQNNAERTPTRDEFPSISKMDKTSDYVTTTYSAGVNEPLRTKGQPMRLAYIIEKGMQPQSQGGYGATTPIGAMLAHFQRTSPSAYTRLLAARLIKIGQQDKRKQGDEGGKGSADGLFHRMDLVIAQKSADGRAINGSYLPPPQDQAAEGFMGTLSLFESGSNEVTVMHEVLHAVTVGRLFEAENGGGSTPAIDELESLRWQLMDTINSLAATPTSFDPAKVDALGIDANGKRVAQLSEADRAMLLGGGLDFLRTQLDKPGYQGLAEFVSYGMTDGWVQRFLAVLPDERAGATKGVRSGNLWQVFVARIKSLLLLNSVPNSQLSRFLDANAAMLGDIYATTGDTLAGFAYRGGEVEFTDDFDPSNPPPEILAKQAEAAEKHANAIPIREKMVREAAGQAENDAEVRKERAAARVRQERVAEDTGQTAVPTSNRKIKKDLTIVDQLGRTVMDAVATPLGRETWEQLVNDAGEWSAKKFQSFMMKENILSAAVRKIVVNTVDKYGTPEQFKNLLHEYARSRNNVSSIAYSSYETVTNLSLDAQQGVLDYIENRDVEQLRSILKDPQHVDMVQKIVVAMEAQLDEARALKVMRDGQEEMTLLELLNITTNPRYRRMVDRASGNVGITSQQRKLNNVVERVSEDLVVNKNGQPFSGAAIGKEFFKVRRIATGDDVFAEKGISAEAMLQSGLTSVEGETKAFRVAARGNSDIEFSRPKSVAERAVGKDMAQVMPSLVAQLQDISRRVEGARMNTAMLVAQSELPMDARWVLDSKPTDIVGEALDLNSAAITPNEAMKKARVPGTWVRLPMGTTPEAAQWGDLQGKWVAGPVYTSMQDFFAQEAMVDQTALKELTRTWKKFKTVYSPVAHMNNMMGNVILSYYHDLPANNIARATKIIFLGAQGKKLPPADQALYDEFMASGATLGAFNMGEVSEETQTAFTKFEKEHRNGTASMRDTTKVMMQLQTLMSTAASTGKNIDGKLTAIYSNQDNAFRLAAYMTRVQQTQQQNGAVTQSDLDEAARFAKESFVDYAITAPWIDKARNSVIPFIAWPYRMIPLLSKTMLHKPWKAGATLAAVYSLNAAFTAMLGADGEDEEENRKLLDEYMQGNIWGVPGVPAYVRLPFGTGDTAQYFGLGRMIPLADVFTTNNTGVPQTINPAGPLVTIFNALNNYDPFFERQIADETMTTTENFLTRFMYAGKDMTPGVLSSAARAADKTGLLSSSGAQLGPTGSEPNSIVELSRVLGVNIRQVNIPDQKLKQSQQLTRIKREYGAAKARASRQELRRGNPNVDSIYRETLRLNQRMIQTLNEELGILEE